MFRILRSDQNWLLRIQQNFELMPHELGIWQANRFWNIKEINEFGKPGPFRLLLQRVSDNLKLFLQHPSAFWL